MASEIIAIVSQLEKINQRLSEKQIENAAIHRQEESWKTKIAQIDAEIERQNALIAEHENEIKSKKRNLSELQNMEKV